MIRDAEIRRLARTVGVEPRIVELDYALGWALRGIANHEALSSQLIFKGGSCLRKCYFPEYRFSEDLDFTAIRWFGWEELENAVREAFQASGAASGIDFSAGTPKLRVVDDGYGRENLRFTIYWRGPHTSGGSPPGLRLDITRNEHGAFAPVRRVMSRSEGPTGAMRSSPHGPQPKITKSIIAPWMRFSRTTGAGGWLDGTAQRKGGRNRSPCPPGTS